MEEPSKVNVPEAKSLISTNKSPQASISLFSLGRLTLVWLASVICGGIASGGALFAHLFAQAGMFAEVCERANLPLLCQDQYNHIINTLQIMILLVSIAMWPGGVIFDSCGARATSVIGALMLAFGILLLIVALTYSSSLMFVVAVAIADCGSLINNFSFYGLLWHLPGCQALLLATSCGCLQVSAALPIVLQKAMYALDWSLILTLGGYVVVVCGCAAVCWAAVPSQEEYYERAQAVLGLPIPRGRKVTFKNVKSAVADGVQVISCNKLESALCIFLVSLGHTVTLIYSSRAVPFGSALFHDTKSGPTLAELSAKVTAWMGLIGVPLLGIAVDYVGLTMLAFINAGCLLVIALLISSATWCAQGACAFCAALCSSATLLFLTKYLVGIAPPHRLGNAQGALLGLFLIMDVPLMVVFSVFVANFGSRADGYVFSAHVVGGVTCLGWSAYTLRLLLRPLPTMVLLEEDETALMAQFMLRSIGDAQEVFALDRKELLRRLSSPDVLVQRELFMMGPMFNSDARARYMRLARARASSCPSKTARAAVHITLGEGWHISDGEVQACCDALKRSWGGGQGAQGEPVMDWMLQSTPPDEMHSAQALFYSSIIDPGIFTAQCFGYVLAIQNSATTDEALGVCACYPPGSLEHFEACPKGGDRWFHAMANLDFDVFNIANLGTAVLERVYAMPHEETAEHHKTQPPHWYISMLGVVPGWRGSGLARRLLGVVFKWADEARVPCYLECGKANVPVYEHLGFHEVWQEEMRANGSATSIHGMLRPSNA